MTKKINPKKAYNKSVEFLKQCAGKHGFHAALLKKENYFRIWARDGVINGLAALMTEDKYLIETFKQNLISLADFQGKNGQIPSNISLEKENVSYGRTAGRVDATLWFIIGCSQYFKETKDKELIKKLKSNIEKAMNLIEAWEFNQKNFVFVPSGGDWADESLRHGYVLFDQLLYNRAIKEYVYMFSKLGQQKSYWKQKYKLQRNMIKTNFWPDKDNVNWKYVYHKYMFKSIYNNNKKKQDYWLENFHPGGFSNRFDAFSNILTILFGFSNKEKQEKIINYLLSIIGAHYLVPAFYPVVEPKQKEKWKKMRGNFSFRFKNKPYHAHNGGLWPMLNGFLIKALLKSNKKDLAKEYLNGVNQANYLSKNGEWGFYEYHHGKNKTPQGVKHVAWSAAGAIMGYLALKEDKDIFL